MKADPKTLTVLFPAYFPNILQFRKVVRSGIILILDNRPFRSSGKWTRMAIKTSEGKKYFALPIRTLEGSKTTFRHLRLNPSQGWQKKHARALFVSYKHAPYFEHYWPLFRPVFEEPADDYLQVFERSWRIVLGVLGLAVDWFWASSAVLTGSREEQIAAFMKKKQLETYLLEKEMAPFFRCDRLAEQGFRCKIIGVGEKAYPQQFGNFVPNLSILDLIFNLGPESPFFLQEESEIC